MYFNVNILPMLACWRERNWQSSREKKHQKSTILEDFAFIFSRKWHKILNFISTWTKIKWQFNNLANEKRTQNLLLSECAGCFKQMTQALVSRRRQNNDLGRAKLKISSALQIRWACPSSINLVTNEEWIRHDRTGIKKLSKCFFRNNGWPNFRWNWSRFVQIDAGQVFEMCCRRVTNYEL